MTDLELLNFLKGPARDQAEWARFLGVHQTTVNTWFTGRRKVGKEGIKALLRAYPKHRNLIIRTLLHQEPATTETAAS